MIAASVVPSTDVVACAVSASVVPALVFDVIAVFVLLVVVVCGGGWPLARLRGRGGALPGMCFFGVLGDGCASAHRHHE